MKWLGIDLEVNRIGVWNIGLAVFKGRHCLDSMNVFVEETFSENPDDGYGAKYFKDRKTLNNCRNPTWVQALEQADRLCSTWIHGHGFSRSFGYNSSQFDLGKMECLPNTLQLVLKKPHVDLMPMAVEYLVGRESYYRFWKAHVLLGNTHEGNSEYAKFSAELVLNYIGTIRAKKQRKEWAWKKEKHVGVEDLIEFEYPILHYFVRILKKKRVTQARSFVKWQDLIKDAAKVLEDV